MICPANVNLSTIAAHNRGSVNVFVQEENGSLEGNSDGRALFPFGEHLEQQLGSAPIQPQIPPVRGHLPDVTGLDTDKDANEFPALVSDLGAGMDGEVDLGVARRREPIHRGRRVQRGTVSDTGDRPDCRARGGHPPDGRVHGIVIRPPR